DALAPSKARFVLLAPLMFEGKRWPAGRLAERQKNLRLSALAVRQGAEGRQAVFVKDICERDGGGAALAGNGLHLRAYGYWGTTQGLISELGLAPRHQAVSLTGRTAVRTRSERLPEPPAPDGLAVANPPRECFIHATDLEPGAYSLRIDGHAAQ